MIFRVVTNSIPELVPLMLELFIILELFIHRRPLLSPILAKKVVQIVEHRCLAGSVGPDELFRRRHMPRNCGRWLVLDEFWALPV